MTIKTKEIVGMETADETIGALVINQKKKLDLHGMTVYGEAEYCIPTMEYTYPDEPIQFLTSEEAYSENRAALLELMNNKILSHLDRVSPSPDELGFDGETTIDSDIAIFEEVPFKTRVPLIAKLRKRDQFGNVVYKYTRPSIRKNARNQVRSRVVRNSVCQTHQAINRAKDPVMIRQANQQAIDQASGQDDCQAKPKVESCQIVVNQADNELRRRSIRSTPKVKLLRHPAHLNINDPTGNNTSLTNELDEALSGTPFSCLVSPRSPQLALPTAVPSIPPLNHIAYQEAVDQADRPPSPRITRSVARAKRERLPTNHDKTLKIHAKRAKKSSGVLSETKKTSTSRTIPTLHCEGFESSDLKVGPLSEELLKELEAPAPTEKTTLAELRQVLQQQEADIADADEFQTCQICLLRYNKTKLSPKFLICGHTVCVACCAQLATGYLVKCPFCRTQTLMKTRVVADGLPVSKAFLELKVCRSAALKFLEENAPLKFDM